MAGLPAVPCRDRSPTTAHSLDDGSERTGCYYLLEQLGPRPIQFKTRQGEPISVAAGDLVLGDADMAFTAPAADAFRHRFWLLPKAALDPVMPGAWVKLARPICLPGGSGLPALLSGYLEALDREAAHPDIAGNPAIVANLGHLIGIVLGAAHAAGSPHDSLAAERRAQALDYVERSFADPETSAATAAAWLGVSVRTLHAAFEPVGTSFTRILTRRRLQASRAALANPGARERSIAAIAFACGFNDVGTFHRAFRRAYGITPSDLRPERGGAPPPRKPR